MAYKPHEKSSDAANKEMAANHDEISFWQDYPPRTSKLTVDQASRLHEIVVGCKMINLYGRIPNHVRISPTPDLSSFTLNGKVFSFIPPSDPCNFRLSPQKKQMLRDFMATEFGIAERWDMPKLNNSEQVVD